MTEIAIVGESWGEHEERARAPFVGASGYELTKMLSEAGIRRADCYLTNVFNLRPAGNKIENLCGPKSGSIANYPALIKGKYIKNVFAPELERLASELIEVDPNIVIAMGNTPCWALLGQTAISKLRGYTALSTHTVTGFKVLPTYHPAAILRTWDLRVPTVLDLRKAAREAAFPEIRRPDRFVFIPEKLEDLHVYRRDHIPGGSTVAVDIETSGRIITCIGFAPTRSSALVIPFTDRRKARGAYWPSTEIEVDVWVFVRDILADRTIRKTFQNGLYDVSFLWRAYGLKVFSAEHDTMLLHHALQPESLKSLGFLGSLYADTGQWKNLGGKAHKTIKRDD
jgi:uracil-DNA glycosylase